MGSLHQRDVNWLKDERFEEARVRWHAGLLNIAGIIRHIAELEAMWKSLSSMSGKKTLLATMTGRMRLRRESATASDELKIELLHADQALEIQWR